MHLYEGDLRCFHHFKCQLYSQLIKQLTNNKTIKSLLRSVCGLCTELQSKLNAFKHEEISFIRLDILCEIKM